MMDSSLTSMSLKASKIFQRRRSGLGRSRLGQVLSIKPMIYYRQSSTRLKQGRSWIFHGGRLMDRQTSDISSCSSLQPLKILINYGQITLLLSTFILITACRFMTGSRRFHHLLRKEGQYILDTMRVHTMMPCHMFGKYVYTCSKRGNVYY